AYAKAQELAPGEPTYLRTYAGLALSRGTKLLDEGKVEEAVKLLETVVRLQDQNITAWSTLAKAYKRQNATGKARQALDRVASLERQARQARAAETVTVQQGKKKQ